MAANFTVKFLVNRTAGTYQIQVTDTSSGFTLSKAQVKITYPDNFVIENTDWNNPDISSAGGSVNKDIRFDINNKVLTGNYVINFTARESDNTEHTAQKSFNLTWTEPVADISNTSDVTTPEVSFKDNTTGYDNGNFTESITTRRLTSSFPSTSAVAAEAAITSNNTSSFGALTVNMVNSGNYFEGDYTPSLSIDVLYTHTSASYLTLQYIKSYSETISIRRAPTQTELLTKINTYKADIDATKSSNLDLYNNKLEEYDLVIGLYSHLIDRIDAALTDGSEQILRDLLAIVEPVASHTYQSAAITQFTTTETESTQDIIGAMVSSNTENGIDVTYNDTTGKINFDVADFTITQTGDTTGTVTVTNLANATLNSTLATVNSTTGSFGSTTAIPVITVNGKGLITNVQTAAISTVLTLAADSGSNDNVTIGTDTLTIGGGTGLTTTIANNNISIAIDGTVATLTDSQTLENKGLDADNNTILNLEVDNFKLGVLDTDLSSVAGTDTTLASAKAIKSYVDSQVQTIDTLSEILANGNTTGANNIVVQKSIQLPTTTTNTGTPTDVGVISFGGTYTNGNRIFNDTSGGTLRIQGSSNLDLFAPNHRIHNSNGDLIQAGDTGVRIYYQNSQKFTTTTNGVTITGSLTLDSVAISAVQTSGESFADNDTSLMTSAAIDDRINEAITAEDLDIAGDSGTGSVDLDSQSLTISGDTGITTTASSQSISIDLDDQLTNAQVGSYGSSSSIPTFTVNKQGQLTAVGSQSVSTTLDIAADSGTDNGVVLGTDTLTISGTSAEVETSVSGDTITVGLPDDVSIQSQLTVGTASGTDAPVIKSISNSTSENIILESRATSAGSGPDLVLYRNAGAVADSDSLGVLEFRGRNAMGSADTADISYAGFYSRMYDASNQDSIMSLSLNKGNGSGAYKTAALFKLLGSNNSGTGALLINPANELSVPTHNLDVNGTAHFSGAVTIQGDLIVSGSQTTKNSEVVLIEDNIITLNSNETGTPSEDSGIEVERGTATNALLYWDESSDRWSQRLTGGTEYYLHTEQHDVALGTHTSGNYVASISAGTNISITNSGAGEGTTHEISVTGLDNYGGWNLKVDGSNTTGGAVIQPGESVNFASTTGSGGISVSNPSSNNIQFSALGATTTRQGVIEIATQAETETGTDNTRAVTPKTLKDGILSKRFFKTTVGNGSDTTITVTHNFGTKFVIVQCADNGTNGTDPGETVLVDTERATNDTVKLYFASAPATNSIDVMIVNCNI